MKMLAHNFLQQMRLLRALHEFGTVAKTTYVLHLFVLSIYELKIYIFTVSCMQPDEMKE